MSEKGKKGNSEIFSSSAAEYFSKNLQQVGFSSPAKALLTTVKEAFDNALDACEENGILPDIFVGIEKISKGTKNNDIFRVTVEDNGPGIKEADLARVFGEYLASSKFGKGRPTRGQQGIGISAATSWAMQTTAKGVSVTSKTKSMKTAVSATIEIDLKNNKGIVRNSTSLEWKKEHGLRVVFELEGRLQLNGEAGLITFFKGNALLNPHMSLRYKILDDQEVKIERISDTIPVIPEAIAPHPHTMKLGEFLSHGRLFGKDKVKLWLKNGFSRINDSAISEISKKLGSKGESILKSEVNSVSDSDFKELFTIISELELMPPPTSSVMSIGEESLSRSISRLGKVDFFAVVSRKPTICDFKPVVIEVAIARINDPVKTFIDGGNISDSDSPIDVMRFANRVPLQFDKSSCAIVKAIQTVNWKAYGLKQPTGSLPIGPYVIAVSIVSPFLKFKNASKETIDASDELVEEIRRALIQAGQKLSKMLSSEEKTKAEKERIEYIEKFTPILISSLGRILEIKDTRQKKASESLAKLLRKDLSSPE